MADDGDDRQHPNPDRDAGNPIEAKPVEAGVAQLGPSAKIVVGQAIRHEERYASSNVKGAECRDEGGHPEEGDQDSIDGANKGAKGAGQHADDPYRRIERNTERVSVTPCINAPATTPHSARTEPTDRSMPPLRITSSIPIDNSP